MTGTYVLSTFAVGFEQASAQGRQLLFGPAVIAATNSLANQPTVTSTMGVRLLVIVTGISSGAAQQITIAGKKVDGVTAVSESTTNISLAAADSNGIYYYCTKAVYGSVNASGVTTTVSGALANATVIIYGITSAKQLVPGEFKVDEEFDIFSPQDNRGVLEEDVRPTQLIKKVTWDLSGSLYPESSQWFAYACVANATNPSPAASVPGSPTSLLAASAFSGTPFSLTTQPTSPGMLLILTVGNSNVLAGTITINGKDVNGNPLTETLSIGATTGTFYSANVYNSVNASGIVTTGFTGTATLAIGGVFVFDPNFAPTNTLLSLAGEHFDGTASSLLPWMVPEEFSIEYDVTKELKFTCKGSAQDLIPIGDITPANLGVTNFPAYTQPIDYPIVGWPAQFYLDPLGTTPGTNAAAGVFDVITFKITGSTGLVPYWISTSVQGQAQVFNRVGRKRRKTTWEAEIDFINLLDYRKYQAFTSGIFTVRLNGSQLVGNNAGALLYKYLQFILPSKRVKFSREGSTEKVVGKVSGTCYLEPSLGYSFNLSMQNQNNPNYAS